MVIRFKRLLLNTGIISATFLILSQLFPAVSGNTLQSPVRAPEFTQTDASDWLNSAPLKLEDLQDKVVLIDFWTFECWNCYRSFPWLNGLQQRLQHRGLQVIGVHTPEFEREKIRENIIAKVGEFKLHHPIMIDNDFAYWNAMGNRFWPAFYIIDKRSNIRAIFYGETHEDDSQARAIEELIIELLAESAGDPKQPS